MAAPVASSSHKPPPRSADMADERAGRAISLLYHVTLLGDDSAYAAVNSILQGPYYDRQSFAAFGNPTRPDVATFARALAPFGLSLAVRHDAFPEFVDVSTAGAFLCRNTRSWFGLRRVGAHWINLNHAMQRPAQLVAEHLGVCLRQLEDDGYEIYAVIGDLPPCDAAADPLFHTYFDWGLVGGLFLPSSPSATGGAGADDDDLDDEIDALSGGAQWEREEYERLLAEAAQETYEDDLQTAIAASLVDRSAVGRAASRAVRHGDDRPSSSSAPLDGSGSSAAGPVIGRALRRPREELAEDEEKYRADDPDADGGDGDYADDDGGMAAAIAASLKESRPFNVPLVLNPNRAAAGGSSGSCRQKETALAGALGDVTIFSPSSPLSDTSSRIDKTGVPNFASKLPWSKANACLGAIASSPRLREADSISVCSPAPSKQPVVGSAVPSGSGRSERRKREP